jgi:hypothetical protein
MPETRPEIRAAREPLTLPEFQRALEQGLGRAILCLQKHDPAPYKSIILEACLRDTRFDSQCEGSRVPYLLKAIELVGEIAFFEERILEAYPATPEVVPEPHGTHWLEEQFTKFAVVFAKRGSDIARRLLYQSFAANPRYSDTFALDKDQAIIELDGLEGLNFVLKQYVRVAKTDSQFSIDSWLLDNLVKQLGTEVVETHLEQLCLEDNAIKILVDRSQLLPIIKTAASTKKRTRPTVSYSDLIQRIRQRSPYPGRVITWSKFATQAMKRQAARDLVLQTDPELIRGYLYVFHTYRFPLSVRHLLKLARHENDEVRAGALSAMRHVKHSSVRALALELQRNFPLNVEAIGILESNYELGDARMILETIRSMPDDESMHWLGYRVVEIYRKNQVVEALEPLTTLYEFNPCSICRESIVALMREIGILPGWMQNEIMWDSNEDTHQEARAWATAL